MKSWVYYALSDREKGIAPYMQIELMLSWGFLRTKMEPPSEDIYMESLPTSSKIADGHDRQHNRNNTTSEVLLFSLMFSSLQVQGDRVMKIMKNHHKMKL